jgi:hypothetical protein
MKRQRGESSTVEALEEEGRGWKRIECAGLIDGERVCRIFRYFVGVSSSFGLLCSLFLSLSVDIYPSSSFSSFHGEHGEVSKRRKREKCENKLHFGRSRSWDKSRTLVVSLGRSYALPVLLPAYRASSRVLRAEER